MKETWKKVKGWLSVGWAWITRALKAQKALEELVELLKAGKGPRSPEVEAWLAKHKGSKVLAKLRPVVTLVQSNPEVWPLLVRLLHEEEK